MRRTQRLATIIATLYFAGQADAGPDLARDRMYAATGARQQAYFVERLKRLAAAIDRSRGRGAIARTPAMFMRQDLDRVWQELNRILALDGRLRAQQYASCAAMLSRIERRLIEAGSQRGTAPIATGVSRRTAGPASPAAS